MSYKKTFPLKAIFSNTKKLNFSGIHHPIFKILCAQVGVAITNSILTHSHFWEILSRLLLTLTTGACIPNPRCVLLRSCSRSCEDSGHEGKSSSGHGMPSQAWKGTAPILKKSAYILRREGFGIGVTVSKGLSFTVFLSLGQAHVYSEGGDIYDAMLNQVN